MSSWSWLGDAVVSRVSSVSLCNSISPSITLIQSSALTSWRLYLIPSGLAISCIRWSMVNLIALWSELRAKQVLMAQSLNVSLLDASWLANDRSITDGLSLSRRARWAISPLGLRRDRPWRAIQSTISSVSLSCCDSQLSLDHSGWWRLKSLVSIVGR